MLRYNDCRLPIYLSLYLSLSLSLTLSLSRSLALSPLQLENLQSIIIPSTSLVPILLQLLLLYYNHIVYTLLTYYVLNLATLYSSLSYPSPKKKNFLTHFQKKIYIKKNKKQEKKTEL